MSASTKTSARPTTTTTPKSLKTKEIDEIIGRPHFSYKDEIRELTRLYTFDGFEKFVTSQLKDISFLKNDIVRTWNLLIKLPNKTTNFRKITFEELNLTSTTTNRPLNNEKIVDAYNMINYIISLFIDDHYYNLKIFDNGLLLWMDDKINYHICDKIYPLYYPCINYYGIKDIRGGVPNHRDNSYGNYRYTSQPHYNSKHKKDFTVPDYSGKKIVDSNEKYLGRDMTPEMSRTRLAANISEINDHLNKEDSKKSGKKKKKKKSSSSILDVAKDAIDSFFKKDDRNSYREEYSQRENTVRFFFGMRTKPHVTVYKDVHVKERQLSNQFLITIEDSKQQITKLLERLFGLNDATNSRTYEDLYSCLNVEEDMPDFIGHLSFHMETVKTANEYDYFPSFLINSFLDRRDSLKGTKERLQFIPQLSLPAKPISSVIHKRNYVDFFVQVDPITIKELFTITITNDQNKDISRENILLIEKIVTNCINHYYKTNSTKVPCSAVSVQRLFNEIVNSKYLDFFIRAQDVPSALYDIIKAV